MKIFAVAAVTAAFVFGSAGTARADYFAYSVKELTTKANVVARVRVVSIRPDPSKPQDKSESPDRPRSGFAKVRVSDALKGVRKNQVLEIYFYSQTCFGVEYRLNEDCVVFLSPSRNKGAYETFNFGNGKRPISENAPYADLSAQIKEQLKKDAVALAPPAAKD